MKKSKSSFVIGCKLFNPQFRKKKEEKKETETMAKLRMAHESTHGARKPPGPKSCALIKNCSKGLLYEQITVVKGKMSKLL